MSPIDTADDGWRKQVMESLPRPAWLSADAPNSNVVISSRVRIMRNLRGYRFPHRAQPDELREVCRRVLDGCSGAPLTPFQHLVAVERDLLVGWRLVSPDFAWTAPGRALLVDDTRTLSVMVNEEDHIRVQSLSAGWSMGTAGDFANACVARLASRLEFAHSRFGYLAASPFNTGEGRRLSAMFHLIGLAQSNRLKSIMKALSLRGLMVRGVFGESSRAIGAIAQVSLLNGDPTEFVGACDYLIREETNARSSVDRATLVERAHQTRDFVLRSPAIGLADAMRSLAWLRWADQEEIPGFRHAPRQIDATLSQLDLRAESAEASGGRRRSRLLHALLDSAA